MTSGSEEHWPQPLQQQGGGGQGEWLREEPRTVPVSLRGGLPIGNPPAEEPETWPEGMPRYTAKDANEHPGGLLAQTLRPIAQVARSLRDFVAQPQPQQQQQPQQPWSTGGADATIELSSFPAPRLRQMPPSRDEVFNRIESLVHLAVAARHNVGLIHLSPGPVEPGTMVGSGVSQAAHDAQGLHDAVHQANHALGLIDESLLRFADDALLDQLDSLLGELNKAFELAAPLIRG